jgi:hypothetical protein
VRIYGPLSSFSKVTSDGLSVPLNKAVDQLIPSDYSVKWIDVDPSRRNAVVGWTRGQPWPAALGQAISGVPGVTIDIGTASKAVLIRLTASHLRPVAAASVAPPLALPSPFKPMTVQTALKLPSAKAEGTAQLQPAVLRSPAPEPVNVVARALASASSPTPPPTPAPAPRWNLNTGDKTLKAAIERWAQEAGWNVLWELGVDYPIAAAASLSGNFEEAVSAVVRSMEQADVPPKAIFYRGNHVLRMVPRGME